MKLASATYTSNSRVSKPRAERMLIFCSVRFATWEICGSPVGVTACTCETQDKNKMIIEKLSMRIFVDSLSAALSVFNANIFQLHSEPNRGDPDPFKSKKWS